MAPLSSEESQAAQATAAWTGEYGESEGGEAVAELHERYSWVGEERAREGAVVEKRRCGMMMTSGARVVLVEAKGVSRCSCILKLQ